MAKPISCSYFKISSTWLVAAAKLVLLLFFIQAFSNNVAAQQLLLQQAQIKQDFTGINCFAQGEQDFLWLGANEGLWRFDGLQFVEVPCAEGSLKITALYRDSSTLYAGTAKGQVLQLTGDSLVPIAIQPKLEGSVVTGLLRFSGKLWLASALSGLHCLTADGWERRLPAVKEVYSLCKWDADKLVLGSLDGLHIISQRGKVQQLQKPFLKDEIVRALCETEAGIWIGYDQGGLSLLKSTQTIDHYFKEEEWAYESITALADPGGAWLYAGTEEFGTVQISKTKTSSPVPLQSNELLSEAKIYNLFSGENSELYIASNKVDLLSAKTAFALLATDQPIQAVCMVSALGSKGSARNSMSAYATQEGVFISETASGKWQKIEEIPAGTFITSLFCDYLERVWMGSFDQGVFLWENGKLSRFSERDGLPNNSVLSINGDQEAIYFGTFGGLGKLAFTAGNIASRITTVSIQNPDQASSANYIYHVHIDQQGKRWATTDGHGIYRLEKDELVHQLPNTVLGNAVVYSLTDDAAGTIWVHSRDAGLLAIRSTGIDSSYAKAFAGQKIASLARDADGNLLVIHQRGVSRINHVSGHMLSLDLPEALVEIDPILNAVYDDKTGIVRCGTATGILQLNSKQFPKTTGPGPKILQITDAFGKRWDGKSTLPYRVKSLRFDFTALWHNSLEGVSFDYLLEGQQESWQQSRDRQLTFSGLRPGEYTFKLRLPSNSSHSLSPTSSYSFKIQSPLWQKWWFLALLALALGFLVRQFIRSREERIRRQQHFETEHIHSQYENLRNQVNPHFLFNSFNTLTSLIEDDQEKAVNYLSKLSDFFRNILDYRSEDLISLENELAILNDYIYLQQSRYEQKFQCDITIDSELKKHYLPPMSLQLLVENAIKHNIITTEQPLQISITSEGESLLISNNFQPRKKSLPSTGLGLDNLSNKFSLLGNGSLIVKNENGTFSVRVPLRRKKEF